MDKINWCLRKEHGFDFIEPSQNIAKAYIKKAEEALLSVGLNTVKDWKISTAYYAVYFSLYAILMRIGVKCEIHSCTIEFAKQYLKDYFTAEELSFFENALEARIDAQYYVDRRVPDDQYQDLIKKAPEILVKCKSIAERIDEKRINEIRAKLGTRIKFSAARGMRLEEKIRKMEEK